MSSHQLLIKMSRQSALAIDLAHPCRTAGFHITSLFLRARTPDPVTGIQRRSGLKLLRKFNAHRATIGLAVTEFNQIAERNSD